MIVTELLEGQGLGNQLWLYAAARSIAEQLGVPFVLLGADRFKGKGFLELCTEVGISASEAAEVAKHANWKRFHEAFYYDRDLDYVSSGFDSRVLALSGTNKLDGLFQSEKYFFGDLGRPKRYFKLDEQCKAGNRVPEDTCVINLRGGEYKRHKNLILPATYWKMAIDNMRGMADVQRFLVVTDDVRYARAMFPNYDVLDAGVGDCYATLYNAKYLILSNSSFSYFPVKTGENSRCVIAPKHWARYGNAYERWASTANLYADWLWQAQDGSLSTYEECLTQCEATESEYESENFIRTTPEHIYKTGISHMLPVSLRKKAKHVLSLLLPRHFG